MLDLCTRGAIFSINKGVIFVVWRLTPTLIKGIVFLFVYWGPRAQLVEFPSCEMMIFVGHLNLKHFKSTTKHALLA